MRRARLFGIARLRHLVGLAALLGLVTSALGQGPSPIGGSGGLGALGAPRFAPEGVWAQVVSVTPKWLVVETENGQQYPVSFDAIEVFVLRWPTSLALVGPEAWAEVTGIDLGSNTILGSQVDIFEGAARNLVSPVSNYLMGYNRLVYPVTPFSMGTFNFFQLLPGEELLPRRRHIVGPVVNRLPLTVALPGNEFVVVQPSSAGLKLSQVTPGSFSFVRPGDLVWCLPSGSNPRSLLLAQLVIYKSLPLSQFVP